MRTTGRLAQSEMGHRASSGHQTIMGKVQTFVVVLGDKEIGTVASLLGAASIWNANPGAHVFRTAPIGPVGPDVWQRDTEVTVAELCAALSR
jgi:hypothetical protein